MKNVEPRITITIPTYNRCGVLMEGLRSLQRQTLHEFECFVVDNGPSADGTPEAVQAIAAEDGRFDYVPTGPEGCVVARNLGFRMGSADLLLTLDDDVELPDPGTLAYVSECFEDDPRLGVLGLSEYCPGGKGKGEAVHRAAPKTWGWTWRDTTLYPPGRINRLGFIGTKLYHLPFGQMHEVDHVRSSAMGIRRTAFEAVGGFLESYTAMGYGYRYETDLCVRVKRLGYKVIFSARRPQVYHKVEQRQQGWKRQGYTEHYLIYTNRNNAFFFLRNYWNRPTAWVFILWDVLVGSTTQPGLLRFVLYHRAERGKVKAALEGKWRGWRMYSQFVRGDL